MNLKNPILTLVTALAGIALVIPLHAQTPAKKAPSPAPTAAAEVKSNETKPATPTDAASNAAAPAPSTAPQAKTETKADPSLTNDKDMLPNGHFSHRVATPKEEKLTIIGRMQMRMMSGQGDTMYSTPGNDYGLVDFNFRRLRFGVMYQGDHHWGMIVNMRLENATNRIFVSNSTPASTTISDNRGYIHEANLWYNFDFMRTRIIFGMINVPFSREYLMSSANLINIERSLGTNAHQQFDNGLMIQFNPLKLVDKKYDRYLTVQGMIGTGHGGAGDFGFGRRYDVENTQNANGNYTPAAPTFYGRVQYNALGGLSRGNREIGWQDGEEIFQKDLKISLGAGVMGTKETKITNPMPVEYVARSGNAPGSIPLTVATNSNTCVGLTSCDLFAQTYDVVATWQGVYFNAAMFYFGGNAGQNITSYSATLGYNIPLGISTYLMPVVRYDFLKGNFANVAGFHQNTTGMSSDPANQMSVVWVGVNLLVDKHLFKLQLFYQLNTNSWKGYDTAGNALGGYKQDMIIFQAQGTFWTGADIAYKPSHVDL